MANPSDKLSGQQKSAVSSEEEEGESPEVKGPVGVDVRLLGQWPDVVLAENTDSSSWVSEGAESSAGEGELELGLTFPKKGAGERFWSEAWEGELRGEGGSALRKRSCRC